jgi:hypothetical protein
MIYTQLTITQRWMDQELSCVLGSQEFKIFVFEISFDLKKLVMTSAAARELLWDSAELGQLLVDWLLG